MSDALLTSVAHHFTIALREAMIGEEGLCPTQIAVAQSSQGRDLFIVQLDYPHGVAAYGLVTRGLEIETGIRIAECLLDARIAIAQFADAYQAATAATALLEQLLFGVRALLAAIASGNTTAESAA